jgi:non-specific serine/threonine protein kinase
VTQLETDAYDDARAAEIVSLRPTVATLFDDALCMFRGLGDDWGAALCMTFYANFLAATDSVRAGELASDAMAIAEALGERYLQNQALCSVALVDLESGKQSEERQLMEKAAALALELNDLFNVGQKLVRLAHLDMDESHFAPALRLCERAISNDRLIGNRLRLAQVLHDAGVAARLAGSADKALCAFEESLSMHRALGQESGVAAVRVSLSHLHLEQGAIAEATAAISQGLEVLARQDSELGVASAVCAIGRLTHRAGSHELAAHLLGAAEALLDRLWAGPYSTVLHPSQHGRRRFEFHRDCIHVRELREALGPNQLSTFDLALENGRALGTRRTISLALQLAQQFAHSPDAVAAGADGQKLDSRLSQREAEVLRLVANGNSNQQIATTLVLSVRTVERHIANVYAKVGARNRADATAYALRNQMS